MGRIVELSRNGISVHLEHGFVAMRDGSKVLGRVALDDVDAVLASATGITWSNPALSALMERGSPVVILGPNYHPTAMILPVRGHHAQGRRMRAQAGASAPLKKRLWASIVKAKLEAQRTALETIGVASERLSRTKAEVRSGDPTNREAAGAQVYWPLMMGTEFRRSDDGAPVNAFLNYGYAVLRAAAARAVVAAGLHPSLSLHHVSDGDALSLADDLMEPFRPAVDLLARELKTEGVVNLETPAKRRLVAVIDADYLTTNGRTPLSHALVRMAQSMAACFLGEAKGLDFPISAVPLAPELAL
jgi:CRISPR-associated protein Cas1